MSSTAPIRSFLEKNIKQHTRAALNTVPHFVPLNLEVLKGTLGSVIVSPDAVPEQDPATEFAQATISLSDLRQRIITHAESRHKNRIQITARGVSVNGKYDMSLDEIVLEYLPAVVYSATGEVIGVLYSGYKSTYSGLFESFLNKEIYSFLDSAIYAGTKYKKGFDVGHILGTSELAKTPLGIKIKKLLQALSSITDIDVQIDGYTEERKQNIGVLRKKVEDAFDSLASKSTYGALVEAELSKEFGAKAFLLAIKANVVIIQDRYENQKTYGSLIEGETSKYIADLLLDVNFSRNLKEELGYRIAGLLGGKTVFKTETPKKAVTPIDTRKKEKVRVSTKTTSPKPVRLRTVRGQFYSLASLQRLLDANLTQKIKENMGDGTRRDVLNLRSGRFAESARVERLSESREGMITAFYTYMKNPYQTFEPGFKQGSPSSRNPRLLISKSIREIAATQVANRMRAVLV